MKWGETQWEVGSPSVGPSQSGETINTGVTVSTTVTSSHPHIDCILCPPVYLAVTEPTNLN